MVVVAFKRFIVYLVAFTSWVIYFNYLSERFYGVEGYFLEGYGVDEWLMVFPVILFTSFFVPITIKNISDFIFLMSVLVMYHPLLYLSAVNASIYYLVLFGYVFTVYLWSIARGVVYLSLDQSEPRIMFMVFVVFVLSFTYFLDFGVKLGIEYVSSMYEVRREFSSTHTGISMYLIVLMEYLVVPILVYLSLRKGSWYLRLLYFLCAVFVSFQVFFNSAMKSSLFVIPFITLGYFVFYHRRSLDVGNVVIGLFSLIVILVLLVNLFGIGAGSTMVGYGLDHTFRRFLVSPALNSYYFFSLYFEGFDLFGPGVKGMGGVVSHYFYGTDGNATTGLAADALARGGMFFYMLFPLVFAGFLSLLKNLTFHMPLRDQFLLFGLSSYVLLNTSILTAQLTYGVSIMMLVVFLSFARFRWS